MIDHVGGDCHGGGGCVHVCECMLVPLVCILRLMCNGAYSIVIWHNVMACMHAWHKLERRYYLLPLLVK